MTSDKSKVEKNMSNQPLTNEQLEKRLSGNNCCGEEMNLEQVNEHNDNKCCLKYSCSKCKKTIFSYETKRPKSIILTLTPTQYETLMSSVGSVFQIIHDTKREIY